MSAFENPFAEPFSVNRLSESVARDFGICVEDIYGRRRTAKIAKARAIVARFCRDKGMSSTQVGARLNRDHTTILYAWNQFPIYVKHDPLTRLCYEKHCNLRRVAAEARSC